MKKLFPFGILLTNWLVGLLFIFLIPTSADAAISPEGKSQLQTSKNLISEIGNLPESPTLDFDIKFFLSPGLFKSIFEKQDAGTLDFPVSKYGSIPFFDVKQTFIHFFYTW